MWPPSEKHFIHGSIFLLANKLQLVGDRFTGDITTKQWFLLLMVRNMGGESPTISGVAALMGSTRQNTAKMLEALQKGGYVELYKDPQDRRRHCVRLTEKCNAPLHRMSSVGAGLLEELFAGASAAQIAATAGIFQIMFQNLEKMAGREGV